MSAIAALALVVLRLLAQVTVVVSAPAEVAWGDRAMVTVEVRAPAGRVVELETPSFAPLRLVSTTRIAASDTTAAPGGALRPAWQVVEWRIVLAPPDSARGRYVFFPFVARVTGRGAQMVEARSNPWSLTVLPPPAGAAASGAAASESPPPPGAGDGIAVHARIAPPTVYVGQQATYALSVSVDARTRERLRRNPEFVPPDLRGVLAYDLAAGQGTTRERTAGGRSYDVHVFQRALFPLQPGTVEVPAASLSYSLPLGIGFFSREESHVRRSEALRLVVREPPTVGRPADWSGAVGRLRVTARVDTGAVRVGDALVYTVRVEGEGNVPLLPRPALRVPWAAVIASGERVTVDSTSTRVRGAKEFDWLLTPRQAGEQSVPGVRYPYFDPEAERYESALADVVRVRVAPGALAGAATPGGVPAAGGTSGPTDVVLRRDWTGEVPEPLATRPIAWGLALAAPVPALLALAVRARPRRRALTTTPERALAALAARDGAEPREVRRHFLQALGARLALPAEALGSSAARVQLLRRCGVTADAARAVDALVARLDGAAFGNAYAAGARDLAGEAAALVGRVDAEACGPELPAARAARRAPGPLTARLGWLAAAVLVAGAAAAVGAGGGRSGESQPAGGERIVSRPDPRPAFARGLDAAGHGQWAIAARAFRDAAAVAPRAPDAWTNAATAAWTAGDTVQAAVGWHRALRLAPRAADVRTRLAQLPSGDDGAISGVARIPADWGTVAALAAWWLAGLALAAAVAGRPRLRGAARAVAWRAAAAALLAAGGTAWLARSQTLHARAVVRDAGPLRAEPSLGADPVAQSTPTDLARVDARQAAWSRVTLDGGRAGWMESSRLVPLD